MSACSLSTERFPFPGASRQARRPVSDLRSSSPAASNSAPVSRLTHLSMREEDCTVGPEFRPNVPAKTAREIVEEAATYAAFLLSQIEKQYLERDRAIGAIAHRAKVPAGTLKTLIDRPSRLKKVCGSIWFNLGLAYDAEIDTMNRNRSSNRAFLERRIA